TIFPIARQSRPGVRTRDKRLAYGDPFVNSTPPVDRWMLVFTAPTGDAGRVVAGLSLALRLALDAQAAGMQGIVVPAELPERARLLPLFADARLRLPLLDRLPEDASSVRVPANWLVHR